MASDEPEEAQQVAVQLEPAQQPANGQEQSPPKETTPAQGDFLKVCLLVALKGHAHLAINLQGIRR